MTYIFSADVADDVEFRFRHHFAGEDLNEAMTALLKRAIIVRQFFDSDEEMLSALENGDVQFSPLRLR